VLAIRHAVKLQNRDAASRGLPDGALEVFQCPIRPGISRSRNQQRMVESRLVSETAAPIVRMFRRAAPAGEAEAEFFENRERAWDDGIARIGETDRARDTIFGAADIDRFDLLAQLGERAWRHAQVIAGVVANFETILVQLPDLIPGHVILLIGAERKSFGDEKRGAKAVSLENGPHDGVMRGDGVIKSQDGEFVGDGFQGEDAGWPQEQYENGESGVPQRQCREGAKRA
jgi:hypothetical protein